MADEEKVLGTITVTITEQDVQCESGFDDVAQTLFWLRIAERTIENQVLEGK